MSESWRIQRCHPVAIQVVRGWTGREGVAAGRGVQAGQAADPLGDRDAAYFHTQRMGRPVRAGWRGPARAGAG